MNDDTYQSLRKSMISIIESYERNIGHSNKQLILRAKKIRGKRSRNLDRRTTAVLLGISAEVVTYAGTILELLDKERSVEAIPLIRTTYEGGVTAQWVDMIGPDAATATYNEYIRQRTALSQTLSKSKREVLRDAAPTISGLEYTRTPSHSDAQARRFASLTEDFLSGTEIYSYYRMMSEFSHIGLASIDRYFSEPDSDDGELSFNYQPRQPDRTLWLHFSLLSLCLGVRPTAELSTNKSLLKEVLEAAKTHEFDVRLQKSQLCFERLKEAKAAHRTKNTDNRSSSPAR